MKEKETRALLFLKFNYFYYGMFSQKIKKKKRDKFNLDFIYATLEIK
jgi:hypothetical protein